MELENNNQLITNPNVEVSNKKEPKQKKPKSTVRKVIEWVLTGIFAILFIAYAAGTVDGMIHKKDNYNQSIKFGVGSFIVLTDSMEPKYNKNDAIITYKEDLNKVINDFRSGAEVDITFFNVNVGYLIDPSELEHEQFRNGEMVYSNFVMTHRLMEVHEKPDVEFGKGRFVFVASGINNKGDYAKQGQYQLFTEREYLGVVKIGSPFLGAVFGFVSSAWGLLVLLLIPAAYLIITSSIDVIRTLKESEEKEASGDNSVESLNELSASERERLKRELLDEMIAKKGENKSDEEKN